MISEQNQQLPAGVDWVYNEHPWVFAMGGRGMALTYQSYVVTLSDDICDPVAKYLIKHDMDPVCVKEMTTEDLPEAGSWMGGKVKFTQWMTAEVKQEYDRTGYLPWVTESFGEL